MSRKFKSAAVNSATQCCFRFAADLFVFVFLMSVVGGTSAQSYVGTAGRDVHNGGVSLSYTVGQIATQTSSATGHSGSLSEGVQQTYSIEELKIDNASPVLSGVKVFPNPTTDNIIVSLRSGVGLSYTLYDAEGHVVGRGALDGERTPVPMRDCPAGVYILRVEGNSSANSYRIVKSK